MSREGWWRGVVMCLAVFMMSVIMYWGYRCREILLCQDMEMFGQFGSRDCDWLVKVDVHEQSLLGECHDDVLGLLGDHHGLGCDVVLWSGMWRVVEAGFWQRWDWGILFGDFN